MEDLFMDLIIVNMNMVTDLRLEALVRLLQGKMEMLNQFKMGGNFKLLLFYFFLSLVSCQPDKDHLIFSKIMSENFEELLNSAEYFDQSKILQNNVQDKIVIDILDEVISIETLNSEKNLKLNLVLPIII
ncbi:hypothetical protein [Chryseobacterium indoltheticum]|uniref:hypothetical protein n=1 Tax=Chryseobacterium indoltheticum TaxID=254 RepID=UPI003F49B002